MTVMYITAIMGIVKEGTKEKPEFPHKIKEDHKVNTIELNSKVKELRELRRLADELQQEIDGLTDQIKAVMTERDTDTLTGDDYKITWKAVTSSRLDTAALKKAFPQVAEQFTKTSTSRRFVLA